LPPPISPYTVRDQGPRTLLDEVGALHGGVPEERIAQWKHQLRSGHLNAEAAAWRHVWLGEVELGRNDQPERAQDQFAQALRLTPNSRPVHGLAAFDSALAFWFSGAYAQAADAFHKLLAPHTSLPGYDRRSCALWLRHAGACAGYHAERAKLGIPEPPRLDPLCGAAGLAACLRAQHLPYDRSRVLTACRAGGRTGTRMQDLRDAAPRLGVRAHAVSADDEGLRLLPKPLIAYVEHDHFITVLKADNHGVSYLCSDCGPWPGGQVNLTWSQWRKLEAELYLAVTRPGSEWDRTLTDLGHEPAQTHPQATRTPAQAPTGQTSSSTNHDDTALSHDAATSQSGVVVAASLSLPSHPRLHIGLRSRLAGHVTLWLGAIPHGCGFGYKYDSLHCNLAIKCPKDGPCGCGGASQGDPVNLATGEEEYTPAPDLVVYNPIGPSVAWDHFYNSMRSTIFPGEYYDYGVSWSHRYNAGVYFLNRGAYANWTLPPQNPTTPTPYRAAPYTPTYQAGGFLAYVLMPNGSRIFFTMSGQAAPTSANPRVPCITCDSTGRALPGSPLYIEWEYAPPLRSGWAVVGYFNICFPDGTVWITTVGVSEYSGTTVDAWYPLYKQVDRNNNSIWFDYTLPSGSYPNPGTGAAGYPVITVVHDSNNRALLTINRSTANNASFGVIQSIVDCYGRQVNYTCSPFTVNPYTWYELINVSEVVASGTPPGPPYRYQYGYAELPPANSQSPYVQVPFLNTITTPSPNSPGATVTATINTDRYLDVVTSIVDGNGNTRSYTAVDSNHTKVTIKNRSGTVVTSYTVGFDGNMNQTSLTDGANNLIYEATFADPNDPYRPSTVMDGNGIAANNGVTGVWHYTWDSVGNLKTVTTPRNTTTTCTYNYNTYATGELAGVQEGSKSPTTLAYDTLGRLLSVTGPQPGSVGGNTTVTAGLTYTPLGNVASVTTPGNNATLNAQGVDTGITTTFNYTSDPTYNRTATEAYGQPLTVTSSIDVANPSDPNNITHFWYNTQAAVTQVVYPILAGSSLPSGTVTAAYNLVNQPTQVQVSPLSGSASGSYVQYNYLWPGGPCTSVQLMNGGPVQQINYTLGNEGELLSVSGNTQPESWTYDGAYRLIGDTDGNGHTTQYAYNTQGYLAQILYPGGDRVAVPSFDLDGNPLTSVDGRGITTSYTYNDPESALTNVSYPAPYAGDNTTLAYDSYGRLESVTDGSGTRTCVYDDNDLLTILETTLTGLPGTSSQSYAYYNDGQLNSESIVVPGGSLGNFNYQYDTAGRLTSLTSPFNQTFNYTYLATDALASQQCGSALNASYGYDGDGALLSVLNQPQGSNQPASAFVLTRDIDLNLNSLQAQFGNANPTTTSFGYDSFNRLTSENTTGGASLTHSYDTAGNPTLLRNQDPTNGAGYNTDNQNRAASFAYDANGNPTTYPLNGLASNLTFDEQDRLTSLGNLTFGWSAAGLRAWKQSPAGNRTYYLYEGGSPLCELDSNGNLLACNTWGAAGLASRHTASGDLFYAFDERGSVAQTVNASGQVLNSFSFDAYGAPTGSAATDPYSGYGGAWGYYTDVETGLTLCGHRFYDANQARFINRDPIGQDGGANLYQYVGGSPLMGIDPYGLDGTSIWGQLSDWGTWRSGLVTGFAATGHVLSLGLYTPSAAIQASAGYDTSVWLATTGVKAAGIAASLGGSALVANYALATLAASESDNARNSRTGNVACSVTNWSPKSFPAFGHTFTVHGQRNTRGLIGRAAGTGKNEGQWLDDNAAAEFLRPFAETLSGPATYLSIPSGLGRVIRPDGTFVPATGVTMAPNRQGGFRTAYPITVGEE
jgi:RHS repeat-associated protein